MKKYFEHFTGKLRTMRDKERLDVTGILAYRKAVLLVLASVAALSCNGCLLAGAHIRGPYNIRELEEGYTRLDGAIEIYEMVARQNILRMDEYAQYQYNKGQNYVVLFPWTGKADKTKYVHVYDEGMKFYIAQRVSIHGDGYDKSYYYTATIKYVGERKAIIISNH